MPFTNCSTVKQLKTFLMPSVLLIVLAAIQCNATFTFDLDMPIPPIAAANFCTKCLWTPSNALRGMGYGNANGPVAGVDDKGCSKLTFDCLNPYHKGTIRINGNPTAKEKVTLTCSGSTGKWQYLPAVVVPGRWENLKWIEPETEPGSGNSDPDVTDVHCLFA